MLTLLTTKGRPNFACPYSFLVLHPADEVLVTLNLKKSTTGSFFYTQVDLTISVFFYLDRCLGRLFHSTRDLKLVSLGGGGTEKRKL